MRKALVLIGMVALILTAGSSARAVTMPDDNYEARLVFSGDVVVPEGDNAGTIVAFDGDVDVYGHVHGSVIAFNGSVDVVGTVTQSVVSFAGPVTISGEVYDDVWSDQTPVLDGGRVGGSYGRWSPARFGELAGIVSRFGFWLAGSISTLILGIAFMLFAPRAFDAFGRVVRDGTGQAIGVGLLAFVGLPIVAIAAFVSIVGIPLGLWVSLALLAIYAVGYTVAAWLLGTAISSEDRATRFLLGWLIARAIAFVPFIGGVAWLAGAVIGLGVITVAAWRARNLSPRLPCRSRRSWLGGRANPVRPPAGSPARR